MTTQSQYLYYSNFTDEETETHKGINIPCSRLHSLWGTESKFKSGSVWTQMLSLSLFQTAEFCSKGAYGQPAGCRNHHTRSHVLSANCVTSDSALSLAAHIQQSPSPAESAAQLGNGSGSLPFNPPLAPKLAQGLLTLAWSKAMTSQLFHWPQAYFLPANLPITKGQRPQYSWSDITSRLRILHWSPLTPE